MKKAVRTLIACSYLIRVVLGLLFIAASPSVLSQSVNIGKDTVLNRNAHSKDSVLLAGSAKDSSSPHSAIQSILSPVRSGIKRVTDVIVVKINRVKSDSGRQSILNANAPQNGMAVNNRNGTLTGDSATGNNLKRLGKSKVAFLPLHHRPLEIPHKALPVRVTSGYVAYDFLYRSHTDTPFVEPNIASHQVTGQANILVNGLLPLVVIGRFRKSNSVYYRDLASVQVSFDPAGYKNLINKKPSTDVTFRKAGLKDSLLSNLSNRVSSEISELSSLIKNPFSLQKLIQANEILKVPEKSFVPGLSDSANKAKLDSSQALARHFIQEYTSAKEKIDSLTALQDSVKRAYASLHRLMNRYKQLTAKHNADVDQTQSVYDSLRRMGVYADEAESSGSWLASVRRLSVGKAFVDYTDLTARNISITGVNFEYNSPFYFAVCAGLVDYRFNDVLVSRSRAVRQYLYMVRAGLGKLESNHLIFSFYRGQKELFSAVDTARNNVLKISGVSAEARVNISPDTYFIGEVAKSNVPFYYHDTSGRHSFFKFKDQPNNAFSLRLVGKIPYTNGNYEAMYRSTGAAFQSFNSFQSGSAMKSWFVKANEYFWDQRIKLSASVRSNDFSNPYELQNYNSSMIFKSVSVLFRTKHFPTIQIGYMPMSQLTSIDHTVVENRFQSLTMTANHFYKVGSIYSNSTLAFSRFYNKPGDTSFVFANASNLFFEQRFMFKDFTAAVNFNRASSPNYELNVIGEDFDIPFKDKTSVGFSIKLNQFNRTEARIGEAVRFNHQVGKMDYISISMDFGYLPSANKQLIPADLGTVQFIKRF